jgi:phage terminase large subunit
MRARYLYGDWNSVEGGYFEDDYNPTVHLIDPFKIPRDWPKFRAMDWGFKAPGVIGWFAIDPDENLYQFYEFNFRLMRDIEVARRVKELEQMFGFWDKRQNRSRLTGVADTQLWEERGDSGKSKAAVFTGEGITWQPADKASIARNAERVSARLRDYDREKPPGLMLFRDCRKTAEMLAGIAVDENDSTVPDKKSPLKHWFDMLAYATARASRGRGSIYMTEHEFDRAENDNEEEAPRRAGGFGYGS